MQQVGARVATVTAQVTNPRQLPSIRRSRVLHPVVVARQVWVLHRRKVLQGFAGLCMCAVIAGLFSVRDDISAAIAQGLRMAQGEFATAGFGIDGIEITGQTLTEDKDIITLLALGGGSSTLNFDAEKARGRLLWLRAVETATVRKIYPERIIVTITERQPVARWRSRDATWLVDGTGKVIGEDASAYSELPLIVGDGAADDALAMIRAIKRHAGLEKDLAALSRIGDRRWDLIYSTGLRVQLPEQGVAQALDQLERYQADYQILDRDVTLIDLRVQGMLAYKPGELAAKQLEEAKKNKPKSTGAGDAEYETPAERAAEKAQ